MVVPTFLDGRLDTRIHLNAWIDSHADTGCYASPSCFTCPLEDCLMTSRRPFAVGFKTQVQERNEKIVSRHKAGEGPSALARAYKLHLRHVQRIISEAKQQ